MKRRKRLAAAILALIVVISAAAVITREESKGIFYRVHGGKADMVLLGSIHVGSREMYPMSRAIRSALKDADVMVFECDTESAAAVSATQWLMNYPQGESLKEAVSEACYERVVLAAQKTGYDMNMLDRIKPWALVSLLSVENMAVQTGSSTAQASALGVEKQVRKLAANKEIRYLETAEEQLLLMDGFSAELQEYLLMDACSAIVHHTGEASDLKHWPKWWAGGDAQAFADSYRAQMNAEREPALAQEYHEALITRRNRHMAQKLQHLLESDAGESSFVTVGLMHLVLEEDSILTELKNMGYTIERIMD